jgi:hypothetical protein
MHPRPDACLPAEGHRRAQLLFEVVRERGAAHPREADGHFSRGTVRNYWGGSSNATTASCVWRAARAAFASTPHTSTAPGRPIRRPAATASTR